ncbi:hypothetical protein RHGRI_005128 [Rhododendron griersonianum]|uniref:Uncharacterized protein n=1 Tax=Rhododendron griersonianum TaxID=479676 RepID=A0AAV6LD96_9ERIC|nr:hypothetical protein RHGRI_005128 [Rhododendron griersonianum]
MDNITIFGQVDNDLRKTLLQERNVRVDVRDERELNAIRVRELYNYLQENRRQGQMAQQRQVTTTKTKGKDKATGSNGKEKTWAIVNNLPPTWPRATIFKNLKLNFMDMRALGAMLEEIEIDIICSEALDEVEQQFTEQEEKQGKKPRQKVAKRRLEFDEL